MGSFIKLYCISSFCILLFLLFYVTKPKTEEANDQIVATESAILERVRRSYIWKKIINTLQTEETVEDCLNRRSNFVPGLPIIYAITPTYARPVQKAELTRLSHTFMLVKNLHWIIVEDSPNKTPLVENFLRNTGIPYTHLHVATPPVWKITVPSEIWTKPKGVLQRNTALEWLRLNLPSDAQGVIYFADDDNSYSLEIFEEMRWIKTVGVWPVGLVGTVKVERPRVNSEGIVDGWIAGWGNERPFAIDMAGFAININRFLLRPGGKFEFKCREGYLEGDFLQFFADSLEELEPKADRCTKVLVWHTRTSPPNLSGEKHFVELHNKSSDYEIEV